MATVVYTAKSATDPKEAEAIQKQLGTDQFEYRNGQYFNRPERRFSKVLVNPMLLSVIADYKKVEGVEVVLMKLSNGKASDNGPAKN